METLLHLIEPLYAGVTLMTFCGNHEPIRPADPYDLAIRLTNLPLLQQN